MQSGHLIDKDDSFNSVIWRLLAQKVLWPVNLQPQRRADGDWNGGGKTRFGYYNSNISSNAKIWRKIEKPLPTSEHLTFNYIAV